MRLLWLAGSLLCAGAVALVSAQEKPAADKSSSSKSSSKPRIPANAVPGYTVKKLRGFHLLVSDESKSHLEDEKYQLKPMDVLDKELAGVECIMPSRMLKVLQTIAIFVEWEDPESKPPSGDGTIVARYWYDSGRGYGMLKQGRNPLKANNIEILNMRHLTEKWQPGKSSEQIIILHELSHAVHAHLLGNDNPAIKVAYAQAMDRGLYNQVKHESGKVKKAYASTSDHEYFAELTCAYLDKCAYFPFTREDLKDHDPTGFKLMETIWGKPDNRSAKAKKPAVVSAKPTDAPPEKGKTEPAPAGDKGAEAAAEQKMDLVDILLKSGKIDKARERLQELIRLYPNTESAKKAKEILKKLPNPE